MIEDFWFSVSLQVAADANVGTPARDRLNVACRCHRRRHRRRRHRRRRHRRCRR